MSDFDNSNTFILFKNDKKGNEKAPDYKGTMTLENGEEKDIAAWIKTSKKGSKFMSGRIQDKWQPEGQQTQASPDPVDDSIPF